MALVPVGSGSLKDLEKAYQNSKKSTASSTSSKKTSSSSSKTTSQSQGVALRDYFQKQGYNVEYDSRTGNIRIYDPKTGSSSMVLKGAYEIKDGKAVITPEVASKVEQTIASGKYNIDSKSSSSKSSSTAASSSLASKQATTGSGGSSSASGQTKTAYDYSGIPTMFDTTPKTPASTGSSLPPQTQQPSNFYFDYDSIISDVIKELNNISREAQNNPSTAALIERNYNAFIEELNRIEANIMQTFQQQLGGIDPATIAAIRSIRETVSRQRQSLMEEMSRRGLLQSGIWLEMERRLAEGELTAQEQLLAQRVSDLQTRMLQALTNFANMRLQAIQMYGLAGVEAVQNEALQRQQQLERNLQAALDEAYRRQQLALQQFQTVAPYMYLTESQRQSQPLDWAQIVGEVPVGPGFENVPVRSYVGSAGTVDYDPSTGEVIINGTRVKPSAVGGFIQDGKAYLPRDVVDRLLGRY